MASRRPLTWALVALLSLGLGVSLSPRAVAGPSFLFGHSLPTNIPNVIKQAEIVQPNGSALPEPTASAYADLDDVVDVNQPASGVNCGTIIPGQCYEYQSIPLNICNTVPERAIWTPQNLVETAFTHVFPGTVSTANRYPNTSPTSNPLPTPCPSPAVGTTNGGVWNPLDASLATYVNAALANAVSFPPGYNLFNDNGFLTGNTMCGSGGSPATSEYGSSVNATGTNACDQPGTGGASVGVDYDSAVGIFESRLNTLVFQNGGFNCCGDPTGCSSVVVGAHGHDPYYANCIDNAYAYHNVFANANGHTRYILLENAVQHKNLTGSGWPIANDVSLGVYVNTVANFVNDPTTTGAKLVDSEYGFGSSGPGDLSGGYAIRTLITALRWLVPNPATGMPDRLLVMYSGVSCSWELGAPGPNVSTRRSVETTGSKASGEIDF